MGSLTNNPTSSFAPPIHPPPPPEPLTHPKQISTSAYLRLLKPAIPLNPHVDQSEDEHEDLGPSLSEVRRSSEPLTITHPEPFRFSTDHRSSWRNKLQELRRQRNEQKQKETEEHTPHNDDRWTSTYRSRFTSSPVVNQNHERSFTLSPHLDAEIADILASSLTPSHNYHSQLKSPRLSSPHQHERKENQQNGTDLESSNEQTCDRHSLSSDPIGHQRTRSDSTSTRRSSSQKRRDSDFNSFYQRMMRQQREKEEELDKLRIQLEEEKNEDSECVFKPTINKQKKTANESMNDTQAKAKIEDRLIQWNEHKREERMERIRNNSDLPSECTFQPKLNKRNPNLGNSLRSSDNRSLSCSSTKRSVSSIAQSGDRLSNNNNVLHPPAFSESTPSTFKPTLIATTKVKEERTKQYLAIPAFERLSQPKLLQTHQNPSHNDDGLNVDLNSDKTKEKEQPQPQKRLSDSDFRAFLQRQEDTWMNQRAKVMLATQTIADEAKPRLKLCQKSLRMAEERNAGMTFLERVMDKAEQNKKHTVVNPRTKESVNVSVSKGTLALLEQEQSEITFSPQINQRSQQLKARSVEEMSTEEVLRRKERLNSLARERRKEEQNEMTFKPKLSSKDFGVDSKLGVLRDPDNLLERLNQERLEKEKRLIEKYGTLESREELEVNKKAFTPDIHEIPKTHYSAPLSARHVERTNPQTTYSQIYSSK
ncbi:hypothetical protein BLNAU_1710 [Blattamonas nauphoetae]|uniref:Uncharacterized protein n=1 Tax=Blattamonas nauphoetae TaxID=2049346 RepID=A0ABQ9YHF2_9EUKA|nr:hypothetical protein BLNAU_1710 [Blattamonas nauphoetae]